MTDLPDTPFLQIESLGKGASPRRETTYRAQLLTGLHHWAVTDPARRVLEDYQTQMSALELYEKIVAYGSAIMTLKSFDAAPRFIPLIVDRNVESACLTLACLAFGIPFAPIDIEWTEERTAFALRELGNPKFVLSTSLGFEQAKTLVSEGIRVEHPGSLEWTDCRTEIPTDQLHGSEEALVIFTSGTTGSPKGVLFNKEDLGAVFENRIKKEALFRGQVPATETITTLCHPFHFVVGLFRLFEVTQGVRYYIFSKSEMSVQRFIPIVRSLGVNRLSIPPGLVLLLAGEAATAMIDPLTKVREIRWGGDSVSFEALTALKNIFPPEAELINSYGATEAASWTHYSTTIRDLPRKGAIPIGQFVPQAKLRLVPHQDLPGRFELLLPGPLATGYLNNPRLTSERFVVDDQGRRWWRSGDVVYLDPASNLFLEGRLDDLVKVRGNLVSPSEATRALLGISGIEDAVVLTERGPRGSELVAHIQLSKNSTLTNSEIHKELVRKLPSYLRPRKIMAHNLIPRNSRGKIDRMKLREVPFVHMAKIGLTAPINLDESILISTIGDVVGRQSLSVTENIWDQGVDSLAALEIEARLQSTYPSANLELLVREETIENIARRLRESRAVNQEKSVFFGQDLSSPFAHVFPGGGNQSAGFALLSSLLKTKIGLKIHLYDPGDPSVSNTSLPEVGRALSGEIRQHDSFGEPIRVLGYSAGVVQAFELAKNLAESGLRVKLAILDSDIRLMNRNGEIVPGLHTKELVSETLSPGAKEKSSLIRKLLKGLQRQGLRRGIRSAFVEGSIALLVPNRFTRDILRVAVLGLREYVPKGFLVSFVEALVAESRRSFQASRLNENASAFLEAKYFFVDGNTNYSAWSDLIPGIEYELVGGNHGSLLSNPHVRHLSRSLEKFWNL